MKKFGYTVTKIIKHLNFWWTKTTHIIARALAKDCPIIVADEPTGNLDSESGNQIMSLLHEISKDKLVIVVTHNYTQVEPYATRRIKMHDGVIVEDKVIKKTHDSNTIHEAKQSKMGFLSILNFAVKKIHIIYYQFSVSCIDFV